MPTFSLKRARRRSELGQPFDLTVVGAGLFGLAQITLEGLDALRRARVVYYSRYNGAVEPFLEAELSAVPRLAQEDGEYRFGAHRPMMYARIAERALQAAREDPGVVALHPGSAVVVDSITQEILRGAEDEGLIARVVPGVSAVEGVAAALGFDQGEGLQVVLAQDVVLRGRRLAPDLSTIIIQPGYFDTRCFAGAPVSKPDRYALLRDVLAESFGPDQVMAMVILAVQPQTPTRTFWFRFGDFDEVAPTFSPYHTLFVPAGSRPPPIADREARLESYAALTERLVLDDDGQPVQQRAEDWYAEAPPGLRAALVEASRTYDARWWTRHDEG